MYEDRPSMTPPVREGEELEVSIEAAGAKGDGIAKKDGFVLFIPGVKEGDNVKVRVTRVLRKVGFAEVVGEGSAPAEDAPEGAEEDQEAQEEAQEAAQEDPQEEAPAESDQDSEDFGEEAPAQEEEAPAEEAPAEDAPEEEPAEEKKE